ncbi:MAG TPA: hypothetical protein VFF52_29640 [Isosphaeraceae bacterium]|nr:hypothetical protein [Isosphaeraceae bacterium]
MMSSANGSRTDGFTDAADDLAGDLTDEQRAAIKDDLAPGEKVLWAERAGPPPTPTVAPFPAFFAAFLCGASGFALMVLFGIYGLRAMDTAELLFYLGLAPGVLGGVVALGLLGRWVDYVWRRRQLSRTFYVLTDRRAIVGQDLVEEGEIQLLDREAGTFDDTLCIERQDGTGDVFFVLGGTVLDLGFVSVARARYVEELVRRTLIPSDPGLGPLRGTWLDVSEPIVPAGD